jgi:hypothetical protein
MEDHVDAVKLDSEEVLTLFEQALEFFAEDLDDALHNHDEYTASQAAETATEYLTSVLQLFVAYHYLTGIDLGERIDDAIEPIVRKDGTAPRYDPSFARAPGRNIPLAANLPRQIARERAVEWLESLRSE